MEEEDDNILTSSPQAPTQYARGLDVVSALRNAKSEEEMKSIFAKSGGNIPRELTASQARSLSAASQQQSLAMREARQIERQQQDQFANSLRLQRAELQRKKYILDLQQQQMALKKEVSAANAMTQVLQLDPQDIQFTQKLKKLKMTNPDVIDVLSDRVHGNEFYKTNISPLEEQNDNIMKSAKDRLVNSGINMPPNEFIAKSGSMNDDGTINWERLENVIAPIQEVHLANLKAAEEATVQGAMERQRQAIAAGAKTVTGKPGEMPTITFQAPEKEKIAPLPKQEDIRKGFKQIYGAPVEALSQPYGTKLIKGGISVNRGSFEDGEFKPLESGDTVQVIDASKGMNKKVIHNIPYEQFELYRSKIEGQEKPSQILSVPEGIELFSPIGMQALKPQSLSENGETKPSGFPTSSSLPPLLQPSSLPMSEEEVTTEEQPARKPLSEIF
jgi:hypothetical protein